MSAPGADAAQSGGTAQDGQGQDQDRSAQQYSVLGEDAFSDAPEELRDHLINYVKTKVDPALTQRFQEASEFRSTWEPFSQIEGLTDLHPEDVDQLVELGYTMAAAGDEQHPQRQEAIESLRGLWEDLGNQFEFFSEDDEDDDDGVGEPEYMTREEFEAELEARENQRTQQAQREQSVEQIRQEMRAEMDKLPLGDAGSPERQKAENAIYSFMGRYEDPSMSTQDVVKAAYQDLVDIRGGAQEELVEDVEDRQTGSTLRGGAADTQPEEVKSWADADKLAKARLAGAR